MALSGQKEGTYRRQCVERMVNWTQLRAADAKCMFFDAFLSKSHMVLETNFKLEKAKRDGFLRRVWSKGRRITLPGTASAERASPLSWPPLWLYLSPSSSPSVVLPTMLEKAQPKWVPLRSEK